MHKTCQKCEKKHYARGLCHNHYQQAWSTGTLPALAPQEKEVCRHMDPPEAAWVAGLFEGEGCVTAAPRRNGNGVYPGVIIRMTDRDVLEQLQRFVGVGKITEQAPRRANRKTIYVWSKCGDDFVESLYNQISPWLRARRAARFNQVLALASDVRPNAPI